MSSKSFPSYSEVITEFEQKDIGRYEPSKPLKEYFDSIKAKIETDVKDAKFVMEKEQVKLFQASQLLLTFSVLH